MIHANDPVKILLTLPHDDLVPFVKRYYFKEISWVVLSHYFFSVLFLALWVQEGIDGAYDVTGWLSRFGLAVVAFVVLIPLHEAMHGVVYWILGAKDIRFRVSVRNAYAYAIAHHYVASAREFTWIAMVPFLAITSLFAVLLAAFPGQSFLIMGMILLHTAGCSGDWAMMNYVWFNRDKELYTYDDADMKVTYFVTPEEDRT